MENTIENKARFFAQYWGQKIGGNANWDYLMEVERDTILAIDYLELKPLSQITDEEAKVVACICKSHFKDATAGKGIVWSFHKSYLQNAEIEDAVEVIDFLRSKGYALPYMGIPVEQQIERGWVKLNKE